MSDNQWSENQPPQWQGPPPGSEQPQWAPPSSPPVTGPAPSAQQPRAYANLIGDAVTLWWRSAVKLLLAGGLLMLLEWLLAVALFRLLHPQGLDALGMGLIRGDQAAVDQLNAAFPENATDAQMLDGLRQAVPALLYFVALATANAITGLVGSGWLISSAARIAKGQPLDLRESFRQARYGKIFTARLAMYLLLVLFMIALVVAVAIGSIIDGSGVLAGLLALVLTVVIAMWVASLIAIDVIANIEGVGGFSAIRRTQALSKQRRWRMIGVLIVTGLVGASPALFASSLTVMLNNPTSFELFYPLLNAVAMLIGAPLSAITLFLIYRNQRTEKEAATVSDLY